MRTLCKKALALCVVFALALTCFVGTFAVSAADPYDATITVADVAIEQGTTSVDVVLNITAAEPGINEAIISVSSDLGSIVAEPELTSFTATENGDAYVDVVGDDFSKFFLSARKAEDATDLNGVTAATIKFTFDVAADKAIGDYAINIETEGVKAADKNETVVNFVYEVANVTVVAPHVHNVVWTSDNAGNHTSSCDAEGCKDFEATTEACADADADNACDKCGYDLTPAAPVCKHENVEYVSHEIATSAKPTGKITYFCNDCEAEYTEDLIYNNTYRVRGANAEYNAEIVLNYNLYIDEWNEKADLAKSFGILTKEDNSVADADPITKVYRVSEAPVNPYNTTHVVRVLAYPCAAKELADGFTYALIAYVDGAWYCGNTGSYSFATYAKSTLGKATVKNTEKTLVADILNYGTAAQNHFEYNMENPLNKADASFDNYIATYGTASDRATVSHQAISNTGSVYRIGAASASFESRAEINIRLNMADKSVFKGSTDDVVVVITYNDAEAGETTIIADDFFVSGGQTYARFAKLRSFQVSDPINVKLYNASTYVEGADNNVAEAELTYSLETYANNQINKGDAIAPLCKMLLRYGDAAYAHFIGTK